MLRFSSSRTSSRPPVGHFAAKVQRKSIWFVLAALVFLVLFGQESWRKQRANNPVPHDGHLVDNVVKPGAKPAPAAAKPIMPGDLKLPEAKPMLEGETKRLFGGVSSKLFDDLSDDSTYRTAEVPSLFTLLDKLGKSDERDIELASIGKMTFVQLHEQSKVYRGEIVTVGGTVRRILPQLNPEPYPRDIAKQYEVWIEPDGGRLPIVALCLELPADYPTGTQPEVDVSGYFFKRLGYVSAQAATGNAAETGMTNVYRSSPLIVAKTLRVRPKPVVAQVAEDDGPVFLKGLPLPIPGKYVLPLLGLGMVILTAMSAWALRIGRTSVMADGPIMGRKRSTTETAPETTNLNSLKLEP